MVKFRNETEPYESSNFCISDLDICMAIYVEVYQELREKVEKNEELPYLEYKDKKSRGN
ncbi:hypothetical protein [Bacillus sp. ISL-37]|uniref:hypothetical protein n=1 Tax=Bacillus sp. ISL-37 TaxID=2819123 RepID=UPI001BEAA5DB|nr:hypothetical protein [Bacillus sp. ISL-37]MBT2682782.1 hypothetical protein [Bacillus sp. ISL-37]